MEVGQPFNVCLKNVCTLSLASFVSVKIHYIVNIYYLNYAEDSVQGLYAI